MENNFGIIYKSIMLDDRLSLEAKAIYSYLSVYAGNKNFCYPSIGTILHQLNISQARFYKHIKTLKEAGIIETKRTKSSKGVFEKTIYYINKDRSEVYPCANFPHIDYPFVENLITKKNSIKNNNKKKNIVFTKGEKNNNKTTKEKKEVLTSEIYSKFFIDNSKFNLTDYTAFYNKKNKIEINKLKLQNPIITKELLKINNIKIK